jgi:hypothetical protein
VNDKQAKNSAPQQPGRVKSRHVGTSLGDGTAGGTGDGAPGAVTEEVRTGVTSVAAGSDVLGTGSMLIVLLQFMVLRNHAADAAGRGLRADQVLGDRGLCTR